MSRFFFLTLTIIGLTFLLSGVTEAQETKKKKKPFAWSNPPTEFQKRKALIPARVAHHSFTSPSMNTEVGFFIYVPEAYDLEQNAERKFPVVFHLHGGRPGSETKSIKIARFVDKAIKTHDNQPTIYVFPNGGPVSWYNYPEKANAMSEDVLVKELIPHIKSAWRTREMAIEGFSQGGRGTTRIMFKHPELFTSAAPGGSGYGPEKRIQEDNGVESESITFAPGYNAWDLATQYAKRADASRLPIMLWVGTEGYNYEFNLKFSKYLDQLNIAHEMNVAKDVKHSAVENYEQTGLKLMKFHQQSFAPPETYVSQTQQPKTNARIAVMETAFQRRGDVKSFALAKAAGYTAMQMHSGNPPGMKKTDHDQSIGLPIGDDPKILDSWIAESKKHGVEIISLCAGSLNKCQIWDRDRELAMRIAKQTIDGSHKVGSNVMLFPFFGPSNFQTDDAALEGVTEFMRELLPYAKEKNVVIGIEAPITTVRVMELLEKLNFPEHLKIYYDTGNLFPKEDIYETIRNYGKDHFCEVHIKASESAIAGEGQIDLQKLAEALDAAQYDKWLVYEANRNGKDPVGNRLAIEKLVKLRKTKTNAK